MASVHINPIFQEIVETIRDPLLIRDSNLKIIIANLQVPFRGNHNNEVNDWFCDQKKYELKLRFINCPIQHCQF